jgi:hypothetical protein
MQEMQNVESCKSKDKRKCSAEAVTRDEVFTIIWRDNGMKKSQKDSKKYFTMWLRLSWPGEAVKLLTAKYFILKKKNLMMGRSLGGLNIILSLLRLVREELEN